MAPNFALGSVSGKLQELLVIDLSRSFNRGETNRKGRREKESEMKKRRGRRRDNRKGQVLQLSLQHLSDLVFCWFFCHVPKAQRC